MKGLKAGAEYYSAKSVWSCKILNSAIACLDSLTVNTLEMNQSEAFEGQIG